MRKVIRYIKKSVPYIILTFITMPIILLYYYLFISSISTEVIGLIPQGFTLKHWELLKTGDIKVLGTTGTYYPNIYPTTLNTLIIAVTIAFLEVIFSSLAGYVISRYKFKGRTRLLQTILILHSFPGITLLIALFYILNIMGLYNTLTGVIIIKVALDLPLDIWIMKGFFDGIPWDLEMSALVDGCNRLEAWWKVIMPNVRNGIMAIIIFGFLSGWSEFIYILTFISEQKYWTLSMLVYALISGEYLYVETGLTATAAIIYMIPVVLFFLFAQNYLLRIQITSKGTF